MVVFERPVLTIKMGQKKRRVGGEKGEKKAGGEGG